jgi:hypothetical protein
MTKIKYFLKSVTITLTLTIGLLAASLLVHGEAHANNFPRRILGDLCGPSMSAIDAESDKIARIQANEQRDAKKLRYETVIDWLRWGRGTNVPARVRKWNIRTHLLDIVLKNGDILAAKTLLGPLFNPTHRAVKSFIVNLKHKLALEEMVPRTSEEATTKTRLLAETGAKIDESLKLIGKNFDAYSVFRFHLMEIVRTGTFQNPDHTVNNAPRARAPMRGADAAPRNDKEFLLTRYVETAQALLREFEIDPAVDFQIAQEYFGETQSINREMEALRQDPSLRYAKAVENKFGASSKDFSPEDFQRLSTQVPTLKDVQQIVSRSYLAKVAAYKATIYSELVVYLRMVTLNYRLVNLARGALDRLPAPVREPVSHALGLSYNQNMRDMFLGPISAVHRIDQGSTKATRKAQALELALRYGSLELDREDYLNTFARSVEVLETWYAVKDTVKANTLPAYKELAEAMDKAEANRATLKTMSLFEPPAPLDQAITYGVAGTALGTAIYKNWSVIEPYATPILEFLGNFVPFI